jgi:hypothetical protein
MRDDWISGGGNAVVNSKSEVRNPKSEEEMAKPDTSCKI